MSIPTSTGKTTKSRNTFTIVKQIGTTPRPIKSRIEADWEKRDTTELKTRIAIRYVKVNAEPSKPKPFSPPEIPKIQNPSFYIKIPPSAPFWWKPAQRPGFFQTRSVNLHSIDFTPSPSCILPFPCRKGRATSRPTSSRHRWLLNRDSQPWPWRDVPDWTGRIPSTASCLLLTPFSTDERWTMACGQI